MENHNSKTINPPIPPFTKGGRGTHPVDGSGGFPKITALAVAIVFLFENAVFGLAPRSGFDDEIYRGNFRRLEELSGVISRILAGPKPTHAQLLELAERFQDLHRPPNPHFEVLFDTVTRSLFFHSNAPGAQWIYQVSHPSAGGQANQGITQGEKPLREDSLGDLFVRAYAKTPGVLDRIARSKEQAALVSSDRGRLLEEKTFPIDMVGRPRIVNSTIQHEMSSAIEEYLRRKVLRYTEQVSNDVIAEMVRVAAEEFLRHAMHNAADAIATKNKRIKGPTIFERPDWKGKITVKISVHERDVEITVADNGIGAPFNGKKYFGWEIRRFFEKHGKRKSQGKDGVLGCLGIGLTYMIYEAQSGGGSVKAEETSGGGIAISMVLPLASGEDAEKIRRLKMQRDDVWSTLLTPQESNIHADRASLHARIWAIIVEKGYSPEELYPDLFVEYLVLPGLSWEGSVLLEAIEGVRSGRYPDASAAAQALGLNVAQVQMAFHPTGAARQAMSNLAAQRRALPRAAEEEPDAVILLEGSL